LVRFFGFFFMHYMFSHNILPLNNAYILHHTLLIDNSKYAMVTVHGGIQ
jgi:hypothetical protein